MIPNEAAEMENEMRRAGYAPSKTWETLNRMTMPQINEYFNEMDRLGNQAYIKEYKDTHSPDENKRIREQDYPYKQNWQRIFRRQCRVQTEFFEAVWKTNPEHNYKGEKR